MGDRKLKGLERVGGNDANTVFPYRKISKRLNFKFKKMMESARCAGTGL